MVGLLRIHRHICGCYVLDFSEPYAVMLCSTNLLNLFGNQFPINSCENLYPQLPFTCKPLFTQYTFWIIKDFVVLVIWAAILEVIFCNLQFWYLKLYTTMWKYFWVKNLTATMFVHSWVNFHIAILWHLTYTLTQTWMGHGLINDHMILNTMWIFLHSRINFIGDHNSFVGHIRLLLLRIR